MLTYSVAIRTLGTAGEKFREELLSIAAQTVQPERVLVYIAEGYARPGFTVGREEYVWVKKGMASQRLLPYDDIESDVVFMLDDDVRLAPDAAQRMLETMEEYDADCLGADTFRNHSMPLAGKLYAAVTNMVFPHCSRKWAFVMHRNGSFSYNNRPHGGFCLSQSCAGNAVMWRKSVYAQLHLEDELWLDELPFAVCDDAVESYKVYRNGFRLGVLYDAGCEHLDGGSSSTPFRNGPLWIHTRTKAMFIIWWRTLFKPSRRGSADRVYTSLCFAVKTAWLFAVMCMVSVVRLSPRYAMSYVKGLRDGRRFVHDDRFRSLGDYVFTDKLTHNRQ